MDDDAEKYDEMLHEMIDASRPKPKEPKVVAYTALHYGKDYLRYAIQSVIDHVDEYYVIYSDVGSHGHQSEIRCPERAEELYEIARRAAGSKLFWYASRFSTEGQQRDLIHQFVPDADVILVLDADEIWNEQALEWLVSDYKMSIESGWSWNYRRYRMPMVHFWRSFHRAVLHDPAFPIRAIYPNDGTDQTETTAPVPPICHMGYAQRSEIVEYKQHVHGHKNEWRTDCDWFYDKFMANAQTDVHPVGSEYWNPEPVDPDDYLPAFMKNHPYYSLDVIP